jgi:hypothetical protein
LQLDFILRVWNDLDEEHQSIQNQILQVLVSKLTIAISKIESVIKKPGHATGAKEEHRQRPVSVKRWKYVLLKECLDKAIEDLENWQRMFDPTWFLIMRVASPLIDAELAKDNPQHASFSTAHHLRDALKDDPQMNVHVFLPQDGLKSAQILDIPFSSAKNARRAGSSEWLILDSVTCDPQANLTLVMRDVRDLARKLSYADPITFGLLKCPGVIKELDPSSRQPTLFQFVFRTPKDMCHPQSLRSSLISGEANHPLSDRFRIAKQLSKSVSYIHTYGFVHKNICPETILTFKDGESSLGSSFLIGFEKFRTAEGRTLRSGDSAWEKDLYRHPHRQGLTPVEDYIMQHDIYSLGVCLLEVGLWESFIIYDHEGKNPSPSAALGLTLESPESRNPFSIKHHLVSLARDILPRRMGTRYAEVVETCLTCLDENNADFGDEREFVDADGILVAVRYIEKAIPFISPSFHKIRG